MQLHIRVKPNSKKDELSIDPDGMIQVRIKAPPVDGKANKYLIGFLAGFFDVPKSKVMLLKGGSNRFKTIEIDAEEGDIQKKLALR